MNWQALGFDWNHARAFLATAEEGSLSAAARALGSTQPTLGRQVAALEEALGVVLFERVGRGLELTPSGADLLAHFRGMGEAAGRAALSAAGRSEAVEGLVAITATNDVATYVLPPILRRLRQEAPGITYDVIASNAVSDLARREADISIRHARPDNPDLIARMVAHTEAGLFASTDYLEAFGRPRSKEDLTSARIIGFDREGRMVRHLQQKLGLPVTEASIVLSSESGSVAREMAAAGLGIAVLTRALAERGAALEPVLPGDVSFSIPVWLVTHRELHTSRRIRLVFDVLAEELARYSKW
ncbi:LysR family transcriptional regulator [Algicella marina]|nr:LysR family transcriptional regulator [Algicella marina]